MLIKMYYLFVLLVVNTSLLLYEPAKGLLRPEEKSLTFYFVLLLWGLTGFFSAFVSGYERFKSWGVVVFLGGIVLVGLTIGLLFGLIWALIVGPSLCFLFMGVGLASVNNQQKPISSQQP